MRNSNKLLILSRGITGYTFSNHPNNKSPMKSQSIPFSNTTIPHTLHYLPKESSPYIQILQTIFFHYSLNSNCLTFNQFHKFANDSTIVKNNSIDHQSLNSLFTSYSKQANKIPFTSFCEIMVSIAEILYLDDYDQSQGIALERLYQDHLCPLEKTISSKEETRKGDWKDIITHIASIDVMNVMVEYSIELIALYHIHFLNTFTINKNDEGNYEDNILKQAESATIDFGRKFQLYPKYCSLRKLKEIFNMVTLIYSADIIEAMSDCPIANEGIVYTLHHFIMTILMIAVKDSQSNVSNLRNFILFLINKSEYNEGAKAFNKETIEQMMNSKGSTCYQTMKSRMGNTVITNENHSLPKETNKASSMTSNHIMTLNDLIEKILSNYETLLVTLYKYYCELFYEGKYSLLINQKGLNGFIKDINLKQTTTFYYPKETNQTKASQHSHIINANKIIPQSALEAFFLKHSCDPIKKRHIDFNSFIRLVLYIAYKYYKVNHKTMPTKHKELSIESFINGSDNINGLYSLEIYQMFIDNNLQSLYQQIDLYFQEDNRNMEIIHMLCKEKEYDIFYHEIRDILYPILISYPNTKGTMPNPNSNSSNTSTIVFDEDMTISIEEFIDLMSTLGQFPEIITKSNLIRLSIYSLTQFDNNTFILGKPLPKIKCEQCLNIIVMICLGTRAITEDEGYSSNIAFFLHKIIHSKGLQKHIKQTFNNKIMNELVRLFNKYNNNTTNDINNQHDSQRRSFFDIIPKN